MSTEYLKQILEQEEHADKIKRDAIIKSKQVISAATDEATTLIADTKKKAEALYTEILAKANEEAMDDCDKILKQAQWECDMLLKMADDHLDKAISVIAGKVIG